MKVGILLLSQDNFYVNHRGELPIRPDFDKELLVALCIGQTAVVGPNTRNELPRVIIDNITEVPWDLDYDVNLGMVPLTVNPPHLLIVTRSQEYMHRGKHFSLKDYNLKFKSEYLELWIKR